MKRVTVIAIAALMVACVLPMAQGQESASNEIRHPVQNETISVSIEERRPETPDPQSRELIALQKHLDQMMVQQKELQNQLRALAERRREMSPSREAGQEYDDQELAALQEHLHEMTIQQRELQNQLRALARERRPLAEGRREGQREPAEGRGGGAPRRERVEEDITVTIPPRDGPAEVEVRRGGGRPGSREAPEVRDEARRERERALTEASRALDEVKRAAGETRARVQRKYADRMEAWGSEMKQWQQSEQMQQWRREMENWQKQMQEWAHNLVHRQGDAEVPSPDAARPAPAPPMPPMPQMPKMPAPVPSPAPLEKDLDLEMDMGDLDIAVQVPEIELPPIEVPRIEPPVPPVPPEIPAEAEGLEEAVHHGGFGPIPGDRFLEVVNHVGSITVRSGDAPEYVIRATIKGRAETQERAREIAERLAIEDTGPQDDGVERILVSKPEGLRDRESCVVTIEVTAPRNARLKLRQEVGDIRLVGLRGSVEAFDRVGSIRATDVAGKVALNVEVGGIDFAAPRDLSAKVKAKAELGGIQSNLPLEFAKTDGLAMGHSASGTIGQGDDNISLNTKMGSIHIRSQASELVGTEGRRREPRPEPRPEPEGEEVF